MVEGNTTRLEPGIVFTDEPGFMNSASLACASKMIA